MSVEQLDQIKIVAPSGGTGGFALIDGIKEVFDPHNITAVAGVTDDGGHSGIMRNELGVLPPGDSRRLKIAFASDDIQSLLIDVLNFRLPNGSSSNGRLDGENVGNFLLSAMMLKFGTHDEAIKHLMRLFSIPGTILSVSEDRATLMAKLKPSGRVIRGETNIDLRYKQKDFDHNDKIEEVCLDKELVLNPAVAQAMKQAHVGVIAPGDLYTSILPHFLVEGFAKSFSEIPLKIFCVNLMTKPGETDDYKASDFLETVQSYSRQSSFEFDYVIANTDLIPKDILQAYQRDGQYPVIADLERCHQIMPRARFILSSVAKAIERERVIRHDSRKLATLIRQCIEDHYFAKKIFDPARPAVTV